MNEEKKPISSGEVLIELERQHLELARKQLFYSRLNCILSAIFCVFMLIVAVVVIKYIPDVSESLHKLENLDRLSEIDFNGLSDAISKLTKRLSNLPFIG